LAGIVGPFPKYEDNREPMLEVIKMHRDHVKDINVNKIPSELRHLVNDAWDCWDEAYNLGVKQGFRNAQTTVLAPTGTIAFMMDCDTTGIEPDIALVKYKVLAGGGMLKIVNRSVSMALQNLGYSSEQIRKIIDYIDSEETIEGAPELKQEHLAVFDCAFKPAKGNRSIHYHGHVKMMGVTQPFISGAISKTINMPETSTVDDIMDAYMFAWEQGLKAVAIYRENSKRSQPLNTSKTDGEMVKKAKEIAVKMVNDRLRMPQTRKSVTHKFNLSGHEGYITVGLYDDGKPGEIFVTMSKVGSTIGGLVDSWATSMSLNLQYGIPVETLFKKFRHQKFEPAGFVKNEGGGELDGKAGKITNASSIVDYVAQFMLSHFGNSAARVNFEFIGLTDKPKEEQKALDEFGNEGLVCGICGGPAKRIGNCAIMCTSCKQTMRSGCGE
jgi:ribonucleoside-diphosphate reductase alpha chain